MSQEPYGNPIPGRATEGVVDAFAPAVEVLAPLLDLPPDQIAAQVEERRRDLVDRFRNGRLGEVFARAAEVEPLIGQGTPEMARMRLVPFGYVGVAQEAAAVHRLQAQAGHRRARVLLVVAGPRWNKLEHLMARALDARIAAEDVVIVWTDRTGPSKPTRYPAGVRVVDFAAEAEALGEERVHHALVMLLRSFRAEVMVNVNSRRLYEAMSPFGRALAASDRLVACFAPLKQAENGMWSGQSMRNLYRHVDFVHGIVTEEQETHDHLVEQYQLPPETVAKMTVLDPGLPPEEYADRLLPLLLGSGS